MTIYFYDLLVAKNSFLRDESVWEKSCFVCFYVLIDEDFLLKSVMLSHFL